MGSVLSAKNRVTLPKGVRHKLGVQPGQEIDDEIKPDGQVIMFSVKNPSAPEENPFVKWVGTGTSGMTTEQILRETRGEDAMS